LVEQMTGRQERLIVAGMTLLWGDVANNVSGGPLPEKSGVDDLTRWEGRSICFGF